MPIEAEALITRRFSYLVLEVVVELFAMLFWVFTVYIYS